jgi:hypothetical protein
MRQEAGRVGLEQTIAAEKTRYPRSRQISYRGWVNKLNDRHGILFTVTIADQTRWQ